MGNTSRKLGPDAIHHPVEVIPHRLVAESDGSIAFAEKHRVACPVMVRAVLMRLPIDLDHQPAPVTNKVQKIAAKGRLPSEMAALGAQPP